MVREKQTWRNHTIHHGLELGREEGTSALLVHNSLERRIDIGAVVSMSKHATHHKIYVFKACQNRNHFVEPRFATYDVSKICFIGKHLFVSKMLLHVPEVPRHC